MAASRPPWRGRLRRPATGPTPRFSNTDYTRGGRFYGDDGRGRIYREQYAYGAAPQLHEGRHEAHRFGSYEADQRWARDAPAGVGRDRRLRLRVRLRRRRPLREPRRRGGEFEDRARDAGDFFRRTGRRISNWFSDVAAARAPTTATMATIARAAGTSRRAGAGAERLSALGRPDRRRGPSAPDRRPGTGRHRDQLLGLGRGGHAERARWKAARPSIAPSGSSRTCPA